MSLLKSELETVYDERASFGGKAVVEVADLDTDKLYSYGTEVARRIYTKTGDEATNRVICQVLPGWDASDTTVRHVREFFNQIMGWNMYKFNQDILHGIQRKAIVEVKS